MYLLNCTKCDDIQRLVQKPRYCECGECRGAVDSTGNHPEVQGFHARLLKIDWEQYDSAAPGEPKTWTVCYSDQHGSQKLPSAPPTGRHNHR